MTEIRLYALGIDEVRDVFGAHPELAERLRDVAQRRWLADATPVRRGLLDRLGPLVKRPPVVQTPDMPTADDVETLLTGRYVAPDRTLAAWRLLESWVVAQAWGTSRLELAQGELETLSLDLVRAGVPAELAPDKAFRMDAQLPLRPLPGMAVGYARHAQARAMAEAYRRVAAHVEPRSRAGVEQLADFFGRYPEWGEQAMVTGRPTPDVWGLRLR